MFNHPIQTSPFEKINFNFDANSHPIKIEENGQVVGESSNKRRRKAPPKKHPSFEDSCDWADEEGKNNVAIIVFLKLFFKVSLLRLLVV